MILLSHFPAIGVSNTYILGHEGGGEALLVDPGRFDVSLLELIEDADFRIAGVLITHDHWNHVQGIKTLLKIYPARIYAGSNSILGFKAIPVHGGSCIRVAGLDVEVIDVEGHSGDSRVYKVGPYLFTGDILSAGRVGASENSESRGNLIRQIREKLFILDGETLILPGHGPPTAVHVEIKWNNDLAESRSEEARNQP